VVNFVLDLADPWGYVLVFMLGLAEGAALLGLVLPGETAMILGGVLVSQGRATLGGMLVAGCVGSALGDSIGYWIGRRGGRRLRAGRLGRKVGEHRWKQAEAFVRNNGRKAVFLGRFLGFLRTLVPPLAGSADMPYREFVMFNAPAAVLWAAGFVLLGVAAGGSWEKVSEWSGRASLILLALVVVAVALFVAARWVRRRVNVVRARAVAFAHSPTAVRLQERFRPQLDFITRRLDPAARFGLFATIGAVSALVSGAVLGAIADGLSEGDDITRMDAIVVGFLQERRAPQLDGFMRLVADAGDPVSIGIVTLVVMAAAAVFLRRPGWLLLAVAVVGGGLFLGDATRYLLERFGVALARGDALQAAFPSSELTAGASAAYAITYLAAVARSWSSAVVVAAAALFALFVVSLALVYLGRETPSAILVGFWLGLLWGAVGVSSSLEVLRLG